MAMPQRDNAIEEIKRVDALLEYAAPHNDTAEAECLRLDDVKRRLAATTETVDEIAHASGYNHNSSFRTAFTTATGLSPGNWRKQSGDPKTP